MAFFMSLTDLFTCRRMPDFIRSNNGSRFAARATRKRLARLDGTAVYVEPGISWENGSIESFNGKRRDEILNGETLGTLLEA